MHRSETERRSYQTVPRQYVSDFELPDGRETKHDISCPCQQCEQVWKAPTRER
jgi:hypothetical protein